VSSHPDYALTLVGHSLGGAVALLAALELHKRGMPPATVTTFGEPKVGNKGFVALVDAMLVSGPDASGPSTYRRLTHVDDPVPLLPLTEWGYLPHAGEYYISKASLPASILDVQPCSGDSDSECSIGPVSVPITDLSLMRLEHIISDMEQKTIVSPRFKLWQLFFAHRDYFTRLGVCLKGPFQGHVGDTSWIQQENTLLFGS